MGRRPRSIRKRARMGFRTLFCVEGGIADRWGSGSGLPGVVRVTGCGARVFTVDVPFGWIGDYV